jgi:hypothetical protein
MPPRVLLSSVFKPFGVDGIYGRKESKIELFHNQLTKAQGVFSLRQMHNSYGIHVIAKNINAPTTVLDFPTLDRYIEEVKKGYDIIGISSIVPNFQKVKKMVELTREISPESTIVLGGFCAAVPDIEKMLEVDYVCIGDGISFMRGLLGLPEEYEFSNPDVYSENREILGAPSVGQKRPQIIVGLGCSYGCDFCTPSYFFGRKHIKFYKSGKELFDECVRVEKLFKTPVMTFVGDDNFMLDLKRAEELRQCAIEAGKVFDIFHFGSLDKIEAFGVEKLAEMGSGTIWIGREGKYPEFRKNQGRDLKEIIAELRSYGIKTVISSILLLDGHTKENIYDDIEDHINSGPTFSQIMHYAPYFGNALFDRLEEQGRILHSIPYEEWHGFKQPWFIHPEFDLVEAEKVQEYAYQREWHELGPSAMRYIEIEYDGWLNLRDSKNPQLKRRADYFAARMPRYRIMLLGMAHLAPTPEMRDMIMKVLKRVESSFGPIKAHERAAARVLHLTGRVREYRYSKWGDAMQPYTRVEHYNQ